VAQIVPASTPAIVKIDDQRRQHDRKRFCVRGGDVNVDACGVEESIADAWIDSVLANAMFLVVDSSIDLGDEPLIVAGGAGDPSSTMVRRA